MHKHIERGMATFELALAIGRPEVTAQSTITVHVFAHTSPFRTNDPRFAKSATVQLVEPSSDTTVLLAAASKGIRQIYQPGFKLSKAGVMLLDLSPCSLVQASLIETVQPSTRDRNALMETVDQINARWGKGAVCAGSAVQAKGWQMKQERKSPSYTTSLHELASTKN